MLDAYNLAGPFTPTASPVANEYTFAGRIFPDSSVWDQLCRMFRGDTFVSLNIASCAYDAGDDETTIVLEGFGASDCLAVEWYFPTVIVADLVAGTPVAFPVSLDKTTVPDPAITRTGEPQSFKLYIATRGLVEGNRYRVSCGYYRFYGLLARYAIASYTIECTSSVTSVGEGHEVIDIIVPAGHVFFNFSVQALGDRDGARSESETACEFELTLIKDVSNTLPALLLSDPATPLSNVDGKVDIGTVNGEVPSTTDGIVERILEDPATPLANSAGRVDVGDVNGTAVASIEDFKADLTGTNASLSTAISQLAQLQAWSLGAWRDKAGVPGTYEVMDPGFPDIVRFEVTPKAVSPQKTVVIK